MGRIRRVRQGEDWIQRRRCGRGFTYITAGGKHVNGDDRDRIQRLVIPPAWEDVWVCPDPDGHLQAVGIDAAGRRQYRYHLRWRAAREEAKFVRIESFAERLHGVRSAYRRDLRGSDLRRERVLACALALLDEGLFRIGTETYLRQNGTFGLATLRRRHVSISGSDAVFDFRGKSGVRFSQIVSDDDVVAVLSCLLKRRGGGSQLLVFRDRDGWHEVRSGHVNGYLKDLAGDEVSAKDFRTWHATVFAALLLATDHGTEAAGRSHRRVMASVAREVSEALGNTPAVARTAYIDPRVFQRFEEGVTLRDFLPDVHASSIEDRRGRERIEASVLALLRGEARVETDLAA